MITRALTTVLLTGFVAGIFYTGAQMLRVTPLILEAEKYEMGETAILHSHQSSAITHEHGLNGVPLEVHQKMSTLHETQPVAHDHEGVVHFHSSESWAPRDGTERTFYTAVSNIVTAIAFSLMIVAVFLLRGKSVDMSSGILWGAAGFSVFALAPALGLPPELPGMTAAGLESRQAWWIGTVIATAIGIGLFTESKSILPKIAVPAILAAPHLIGAPHPFLFESSVPAELSAQFAVASLVTSAFFWLVLGTTSAYFYKKLVQEPSGDFLKTSTLKPQ